MSTTRRSNSMSKGFLWFAQNNNFTDYTKLSVQLARSIKKHNNENKTCVIVDQKSVFESEFVDHVVVMKQDSSDLHAQKFSNEHKAFSLTPFTHTIKLEADMLFTSNTDWWWNYLCKHDMVFSVDCKNYHDETIKNTPYRRLFEQNHLPNIYNGLTYFRKSQYAMDFFNLCKQISQNWEYVSKEILINCHDEYPSTDVVYALASRIMDPLNLNLIDYPWFKFLHGKPAINKLSGDKEYENYLYPIKLEDRIYLGGKRLHRIWHYYDKRTTEVLDGRVFKSI